MSACLDRASYDKIWEQLIFLESQNYTKEFEPFVSLTPNAQEEIWQKYVALNQKCKQTYMKDVSKLLDRHKVAACYMIAICMTEPLRLDRSELKNTNAEFVGNELLAISVGTAIVVSYAKEAIKQNQSIDQNIKDLLLSKLEKGMQFPKETHHGEYVLNYATELKFSGIDSNFNILAIAHELFLLEMYTLYCVQETV